MKSFRRLLPLAFGLALAPALLHAAEPSAPTTKAPAIEEGALNGAQYKIVFPAAKWNGRLILLAHGLRPENGPLTAEFDYGAGTAMGSLLKQGYIVASTSFRRNGWILAEAIDDLAALRDKVVATHGIPAMTLVVGTSMGGVIATTIAEKNNLKVYQGALAIAAALGGGGADPNSLSHTPQIPLLFLSNRNEASAPEAYVKAAFNGPVVPAQWTVNRDGHANLTEAERLAAILALANYCETGRIEANKDATISAPAPASKAAFQGSAATAFVAAIDPAYGNISTGFVAADLEKLGLKKDDPMQVTAGETTVSVPWKTSYADVPKGAWLAFVKADGHVEIARCQASAAQALNLKVGDKITIAPEPPAT